MKNIIAILSMIFLFQAPGATAAEAGSKMPSLSKLLPDASLPNTSGKVVLVDFWASWCAPCKASFPAMNRLHDKYAGKGLVIIAIGVDDEPEKYKAFAGKMRAKFPLFHDTQKKAAASFDPPSMPTSYIIDRKGVIRHVHAGFRGAKTEKQYAAEIESLL
jgi:thiol-disulfide isomerase/thioredoxin